MKSNKKLKQEARAAYSEESKGYSVLGGQIVEGKYFRFKDAHLKHKKGKNITTASIRLEHGRPAHYQPNLNKE